MSLFGNLSPDGELQTSPDVTITLHAAGDGRRGDRMRGLPADGKLSPEPSGPCLAVLMSAGVKWGGKVLPIGDWRLPMSADIEMLASVAEPSTWAGVQLLEMRIYPMGAEIPTAFLPTTQAPAWVGTAGRKTRWEPVGDAMPEKFLTDGKRGLVLRLDGGKPVMDWYHTAPRAVFSEIDDIQHRGDGVCLQASFAERNGRAMAAEYGPWFVALPTVFRPLPR
jgi:hypothetical protein